MTVNKIRKYYDIQSDGRFTHATTTTDMSRDRVDVVWHSQPRVQSSAGIWYIRRCVNSHITYCAVWGDSGVSCRDMRICILEQVAELEATDINLRDIQQRFRDIFD